MKATITQDNAISLLGADDIPDNHLYTEVIRQNTLRGVKIEQGEAYKIDLTNLDPENAAVTRTSSGEDSYHIQGTSKLKEGRDDHKAGPGVIHPNGEEGHTLSPGGSGGVKAGEDYYLHPGAISGIGKDGAGGTHGPRTGESPAIAPENPLKQPSGIDPNIRPGTLSLGGNNGLQYSN